MRTVERKRNIQACKRMDGAIVFFKDFHETQPALSDEIMDRVRKHMMGCPSATGPKFPASAPPQAKTGSKSAAEHSRDERASLAPDVKKMLATGMTGHEIGLKLGKHKQFIYLLMKEHGLKSCAVSKQVREAEARYRSICQMRARNPDMTQSDIIAKKKISKDTYLAALKWGKRNKVL